MRSEFSLPDGSIGKNAIIIRSSSLHIDNKKKYILILVKCPTQGSVDTTLTAEAQYSIIFQDHIESSVKVCIIMEATVFLFVNATKICEFKANNSKIKIYPLYLGKYSKDFISINMKKMIKWISRRIFC